MLPILYLRGLSTGDIQEALKALLGNEAAGLPPSGISKLLSGWMDEYQRSGTRGLRETRLRLHLGGRRILQQIMCGGREGHRAFREEYGAKYPKGLRDADARPARAAHVFIDFPAEH